MKRQLAILLFGYTTCGTAFGAAIDWWNHLTICQVNNTNCYGNITAGIDSSPETGWDISGNCRGRKIICPTALTDGGTEPVPMDRADIIRYTGISSDFDTDIYVSNEQCYGARKTSQNGTMVLINGEYERVWCNGVLINPTDTVANGEIGPAPSCFELATDNYVATLNGNCYGKRYDPRQYSIDCENDTPVIIVLNGAEYDINGRESMTTETANEMFRSLQESATRQRAIHFPQ